MLECEIHLLDVSYITTHILRRDSLEQKYNLIKFKSKSNKLTITMTEADRWEKFAYKKYKLIKIKLFAANIII